MCDVIDHDGRPMGGTVGFDQGDDGDLVWRVDRETRIVADPSVKRAVDASEFDFFCRHADGDPWESIEMPPPLEKMLVVPAGSTLRAVPKDPDFQYPEPEQRGLDLTGMV